jgi:hypothetical protein
MTPEEHLKKAEEAMDKYPALSGVHAMMAAAKFLEQFEICHHGTRGFCSPCMRLALTEMGLEGRGPR